MAPITRATARRQLAVLPKNTRALDALEDIENKMKSSSVDTKGSCITRKNGDFVGKKKHVFGDITNNSSQNTKDCIKGVMKAEQNINNKYPALPSHLISWDASDFEILEKLGEGAQSSVFRGRDKRTGTIYAIKEIDYNCNRKYADQELEIHGALDFHGIVRLHGSYRVSKPPRQSLCLVLEYCPKTLMDILKDQSDGRISEPLAAVYFSEVLATLVYIHGQRIVHRDIKMENVLVSQNNKAKIADFGIATSSRDPAMRKTIIGTAGYMAPEIEENSTESEEGARFMKKVKEEGAGASFGVPVGVDLYNSQYSDKVDLYSLGVTLYVMVTGKTPLEEDTQCNSDFDFCFDTSDGVFDFDYAAEVISMDALDLILGLLEEDPTRRLSLREVQDHVWVKRYA